MELHSLLRRQLLRAGIGDPDEPPTPEQWRTLLASVSRTYVQADQDRYTMERSLAVSSDEMQALYHDLRRSSESALAAEHEQLQKSTAVMQSTFDVAIEGILVVNADHSVMSFNRGFADIWRIPEDLRGTRDDAKLLGYVKPLIEGWEAFAEQVQYLYDHPSDSSRDEIRLVDGRVLDRYSAPAVSAAGVNHGRVWFFRDVTAERRAEEALRGWAKELERHVSERTAELHEAQARLVMSERLAAIGQLAAGVAHEINNPLSYVCANVGYAMNELSKPRPGDGSLLAAPEVLEALAQAQEGAERIRNTTRDLKVFARGGSERRGAVELVPILESCINMAWNEIRHRARLVKDFGQIPPVEANGSRLGQVFLNLLINAAQAIPEGAAERNEIRVATRLVDGLVEVEISDTGDGIAPETLGQIFEPFFTTKPVGVGTGLGLPICHGIIRSMGGHIEVESEPHRGALFRVRLPIARSTSVAPAPPRVTPGPGRRGRILVIDDEPFILEALGRLLGRHHEVRAFADGRAALEALRGGERFDVILCDLMMPDLSGMDFYGQLEQDMPGIAERIVFMTGGTFTARAREFLDATANARIEKPFDVEMLRSVIQERIG